MIDVKVEREIIIRFDPEEQQYCEKLLDEIERLSTGLQGVKSRLENMVPGLNRNHALKLTKQVLDGG